MSNANQNEPGKIRNEKTAFECLRCGACCRWPGHVLLAGGEAEAIAGFLGMPAHAFIERFTMLAANRACLSLAEAPDGACVFLEGNSCGIQPVKPRQCRDFPLHWTVTGARAQCAALRSGGASPEDG